MELFNRISARRGQKVALDATFYLGGKRTDPWAIYRVEIFKGKVADDNIIDAVDISSPDSTEYPSPLIRPPAVQSAKVNCPPIKDDADGDTNAEYESDDGKFRLVWDVPNDISVPDIYFDVWYFFSTDPGATDLSQATNKLIEKCNRFWIYPDSWYVDGGLQTVRFGFEPLDIKFRKPENRPLEVGIMPLPLYDYNYNLVAPLIPFVEPRISIWTEHDELVVDSAKCSLKIRQGSFRSNPWVVSHNIDTCKFFKGTYKYRIIINMPDGTSRVSGEFFFTVS